MRIKEIKLYKFSELSDEAKEKAIEKLSSVNVEYIEWWESVYSDAEDIGLKIKGFDLDRGSYVKGDFIEYAETVANKIIENHGENCETYKDAKNYLKDLAAIVNKTATEDDIDTEDIDREFLKTLLEDYRIMLKQEYEYLTSKEAIIETIEANNYEFNENGNIDH